MTPVILGSGAFAGAPGRFASVADAGREQVDRGDLIFIDGFAGLQ